MPGLRSKQPLQQQSLSAWLVFLSTVIVYMCSVVGCICICVVCICVCVHVVWWFCGGQFYWFSFIKRLFSTPSGKSTVIDIKQISNIKYVSAVATENIYLLSFVALVLIMLRGEYLNLFFVHFTFFKTGLNRECNEIFRININFPY